MENNMTKKIKKLEAETESKQAKIKELAEINERHGTLLYAQRGRITGLEAEVERLKKSQPCEKCAKEGSICKECWQYLIDFKVSKLQSKLSIAITFIREVAADMAWGGLAQNALNDIERKSG